MDKYINNKTLWIIILIASLNLIYLGFFASNDAVTRVLFIAIAYVLAVAFTFLKEETMAKQDLSNALAEDRRMGREAALRGDTVGQHQIELARLNDKRKKAWFAGFVEGAKEAARK